MDELEKALHTAFAPNRVNENREFFRISPSQPLPILKLLHHMNEGDVTAEVAAEIENDLDASDKSAVAKAKGKRPQLDFMALGMSVGDVLKYTKDPSVSVSVASNRKVLYNGEEMSLTAVTTSLLGSKRNVQPTPYWEFNGQNLRDIYDDVYSLNDEL